MFAAGFAGCCRIQAIVTSKALGKRFRPLAGWLWLQVEGFYIKSGYLLPSYHKSYWIGMTTQKTGGRPNWYW